MIDLKTGKEWHTTHHGKLVVKGIDFYPDEYQNDKHHSYRIGTAYPENGKVFSIWENETHDRNFYIAIADDSASTEIFGGCYGKSAWVKGGFRVLAHGDGVRATRLLEWVISAGGIENISPALAKHWGEQIKIRGKAIPDPLPENQNQEGER